MRGSGGASNSDAPPLAVISASAVASTPETPSALPRSRRIFVSPGAGLSPGPPPHGTGYRCHSHWFSSLPSADLRNQFTKARSSSFRVLCRSFLLGSADRLSLPCRKIMYRYNENLTFSHSFNVRNILPVSIEPVKPYAGRKSKARKARYHAGFTTGI